MLQTAFWASCMNWASVFEWHKRFKESRESVREDERCGKSKEVNTPELIGQRLRVRFTTLRFTTLSVGLLHWGLLHWVLASTVGRGQHSSNRLNGIFSRTMYQSTTPSLPQTIWQTWASRQFPSLPIVQILLPVTFGYFLSSEAVVMRQLRRWKRLWRRSLTR